MNFTLPIIVPGNVEIVVASFGGVGTTFLMDYLSKYKKTNFPCDRDLLKHSPVPPISFNREIRFLYVYGDPITATVSLFRRKYHHWQAEKLTRYSHQRDLNILPQTSLAEYATNKVDSFEFRNHFFNWYDNYLAHPTMFIRYESIFDNVRPLVDFLGLPSSAIDDFPKRKKRQSSLNNIEPKTLANLQKIHGSFAKELDKLNDVELKIPSNHRPLIKTYLSYPYPNIILTNLLDFKMIARNNSFTTYKELKRLKELLAGKIINT